MFRDFLDLWKYFKWWMRGPFRSDEMQKMLIALGAVDRKHDEVSTPRW